MKENKTQKGITLIALIITVIVLLILAGTAISISINGGNIFEKAQEAREGWNLAVRNEETSITELLDLLNQATSNGTRISKDTTTNNGNGYVGYYADINKDGEIDGIIYADLLTQAGKTGSCGNNGTYTITSTVNESNVKNYVISEEPVTDSRFEISYHDPSTYTARYVISPEDNSANKQKRFYVMDIEDLTDGYNTTLNGYSNANASENMTDFATITSMDFGTGKSNSDAIFSRWNLESESNKNDRDVWKWLKIKNENEPYADWFLPSIGEWSAFKDALGITPNVYINKFGIYGLNVTYASSSIISEEQPYGISVYCLPFTSNEIGPGGINGSIYNRASAIF